MARRHAVSVVDSRPVSGQLAARRNVVQSIRENAMCEKKQGCQEPKLLKGKPQECTPEQIKECHGDAKDHPCVKRDDDE